MNFIVFKNLFYCFALFVFGSCSVEYYVSPEGDDQNNGSYSEPFATIEKALEMVGISFQNNPNRNCTIFIADGKYSVKKPIEINSNWLSNSDGTLYIKAMNDSRPIVTGGVSVNNWTNIKTEIWKAELPSDFQGTQLPRELFIDGRRSMRARFPTNGFLRIKQSGEDRRTNFYFEKDDFPPPADIEQTELVFFHDWSVSRIDLKAIDYEQGVLIAIDTIGARDLDFFAIDGWEPHPRYYLENDVNFLDQDYEWCTNSRENSIYIKFPKDIDPNDLDIVIPFSEGIVKLFGTNENPLRNVNIEGIAFKHSAWYIPSGGYRGVQATHFDSRIEGKEDWSVVPAAVMGEWLRNCSIRNCVFENLGGGGIWLGAGSKECSVSNSRFEDISGNGIMIGEGGDRLVDGKEWWKTAPEQIAFGNTIEKCIITECGKQFYGAVGIWSGFTARTKITNNEIFNLPYSGISMGWIWNSTPTPCRENIISNNHIHHVMEKLSDGGGIYMLGRQPDSEITNNLIHDIKLNAGRAESNGMFLDEGTSDLLLADNVIYNIAKSPLRFHKASINLVKDNFLFCEDNIPPIRYNATDESDIKLKDNLILHKSQSEFEYELDDAVSRWKSNSNNQ